MTLSLIYPDWPAPERVKAYTSTRVGGVSTGDYHSLNVALHVQDNAKHVAANRQLLPNFDNIVWLEQVHGTHCIEAIRPNKPQCADASYSVTPDIACAVMTADCLPILLCDKQASFVAAVHAGWRGLSNGVIENTLNNYAQSPGQLMAWLGPAISQRHFEVGEDVRAAFVDHSDAFVASTTKGKFMADLYRIASAKLTQLGINNIYGGNYCTYAQAPRFFSHRRATHSHQQCTGRMVSVVYLSAHQP